MHCYIKVFNTLQCHFYHSCFPGSQVLPILKIQCRAILTCDDVDDSANFFLGDRVIVQTFSFTLETATVGPMGLLESAPSQEVVQIWASQSWPRFHKHWILILPLTPHLPTTGLLPSQVPGLLSVLPKMSLCQLLGILTISLYQDAPSWPRCPEQTRTGFCASAECPALHDWALNSTGFLQRETCTELQPTLPKLTIELHW